MASAVAASIRHLHRACFEVAAWAAKMRRIISLVGLEAVFFAPVCFAAVVATLPHPAQTTATCANVCTASRFNELIVETILTALSVLVALVAASETNGMTDNFA